MREISLINELKYNKQYKEIVEVNGNKYYDGDNYICDTVELKKDVYKAEEIVDVNDETNKIVNDVTNSFIETFNNRGGATEEQINFAKETSKIVFGELKDDLVTVIPAPCGFGKSSISLEILKKLIELHKNKLTTDGLILVTDRLDSLRDTENTLKEMGLDGYTYILQGWNENVCNNKKIKQADSKICTPKKCPYFYECQIYEQQKEQNKYPILMITNARLSECGDSINRFSKFENGTRKILLIDERPEILDIVKVNKTLLNQISTEISNCEYESTQEKTILENKWKEITNIITDKMQRLRDKYKRLIVSNINNEPICKLDDDFMKLWNKYMKCNYKRELEHIHTVLTKGGFYVYEKNKEFISTIGSRDLKDLYCNTFKTIIFDGTALYDPLYLKMYRNKSIKYLDIENTRLYDNLNINAYMRHKLTKTTFKDKNYFVKACGKFVNNRMHKGLNNKGYVVSYQSISTQLFASLTQKYKIPTLNDYECYYFGNTKGKNDMQDCNIMFQFGWDTLPDYDYAIQWLSVTVNWDGTLKVCADKDKAESSSDDLIIKDRSKEQYGSYTYSTNYKCYEFGLNLLNQFKMLSIVTNFYQEVHRTKLRKYTCTDQVEINVFSIQNIILDMIEQLFPKCNLDRKKEELDCFKESKADGRENKGETYTKFKDWLDKQIKDRKVTSKEVYSESGLDTKSLNKLKGNNSYVKEWFQKHTLSRGVYIV